MPRSIGGLYNNGRLTQLGVNLLRHQIRPLRNESIGSIRGRLPETLEAFGYIYSDEELGYLAEAVKTSLRK